MSLVESSGWLVIFDALFDEQYATLVAEVEAQKAKNPNGYLNSNADKRLRMVTLLVTEIIPADPSAVQYRLGKTLRSDYKHWRRAKFFQQYRLFFRYDSKSKIIIFSWFNDDETLRAYGTRSDAYVVFQKMLDRGNPPNDWVALLRATKKLDRD